MAVLQITAGDSTLLCLQLRNERAVAAQCNILYQGRPVGDKALLRGTEI